MEKIKKHGISCLVKLFFCYILYGLMFNEFLVNKQDGIWNGTYFNAGNWELSLGRWAIRYWDKLHYGISVHPFSSVVTLVFFIFGTCLLIDLFNIKAGSLMDYLISGLFLSNIVVCVSLSYLFTSGIYGLSFFLSILCIWCIKKVSSAVSSKKVNYKTILTLVIAICSVVLMLGLYQAYLGCIALVGCAYLIFIILNREEKIVLKSYVVTSTVTAILGGVLYERVLNEELLKYNVRLDSYKGANSLSLINIFSKIAPSLKYSYKNFLNYFTKNGYRWNLNDGKLILICLFVVICAVLLYSYAKHSGILEIIFSMVLFFAMPFCVNIVAILVPNSGTSERQTAPLALVFPVIIALSIGLIEKNEEKLIDKIMTGIALTISAVMIWGSAYQTIIDQEAMHQGSIAVKTISNSVISELEDMELYSANREYAIIGSLRHNNLIYLNELYYMSNSYAAVAGSYWSGNLDSWTWRGIFHNMSGINLKMCNDGEYVKLLTNLEVQEMPVYPEKGFIREIEGIVVIKLSSNQ